MSSQPRLGRPWLHLRRTDSTNERARELAIAGAPHGTLVTAEEQTAGRGRHGRSWLAPAGSSLLCSVILREPPVLLSLIAGVAVCDVAGKSAWVKWPNDVVIERERGLAKLAGILVEGRPQEGWAVLGIGVNVAVKTGELPAELRARAASLERDPSAVRPLLGELLAALSERLAQSEPELLDAWSARDALHGREISWTVGRSQDATVTRGRAEGIDAQGRLLVEVAGERKQVALGSGEVRLEPVLRA
jgi:BirA family transcriptional regulator, biotin operon repressor / biotin---[acetyl-CoA-carboxylase] ligase